MKTDAIRAGIKMFRAGESLSLVASREQRADEMDTELTALEAENAAMRGGLQKISSLADYEEADEYCNDHHSELDGIVTSVKHEADNALSPPTGKVLVEQDWLEEHEWVSVATRAGIDICLFCKRSKDAGHADDCKRPVLTELATKTDPVGKDASHDRFVEMIDELPGGKVLVEREKLRDTYKIMMAYIGKPASVYPTFEDWLTALLKD